MASFTGFTIGQITEGKIYSDKRLNNKNKKDKKGKNGKN